MKTKCLVGYYFKYGCRLQFQLCYRGAGATDDERQMFDVILHSLRDVVFF